MGESQDPYARLVGVAGFSDERPSYPVEIVGDVEIKLDLESCHSVFRHVDSYGQH
jgi:hypothetical protein